MKQLFVVEERHLPATRFVFQSDVENPQSHVCVHTAKKVRECVCERERRTRETKERERDEGERERETNERGRERRMREGERDE